MLKGGNYSGPELYFGPNFMCIWSRRAAKRGCLKSHSASFWTCSGMSTTPLDNLVHHNTWKTFLLICYLNLPYFNFKLLPFDLSLQSLVEISFLLSVLKGYNKIYPEYAFPQTEESHVPQPFSMGEVFQPCECLCGPPLFIRSMSILRWRPQRVIHFFRWGLTGAE